MTELDLYKFVEQNKLEYHWNGEELNLFVDFHCLSEFTQLLGYEFLSEVNQPCVLKDSFVGVEMTEICDKFGLDAKNVFAGYYDNK